METQKKSERKFFLARAMIIFWLIAPAVVYAADDTRVYGMTPGRLTSVVTAVVGFISVIIGGLAFRSSASMRYRKNGSTVAQLMGLVCIVLSLVHLARATGGFGTGSGKLGAIVALVIGAAGMVLGGMASARLRRIAKESSNQASDLFNKQ